MARITGDRIVQYILRSRINKKKKAAKPPANASIDITSQKFGCIFMDCIGKTV
jgi:hypothetical protein